MKEPDVGKREYTGFPLGLEKFEYEKELRYLTVAQLEDSLEIKRWLVIDPEATNDAYRYFFALQIQALVKELKRRKQLLKRNGSDPLAPRWVGGKMAANRDRIEAVKQRWPIDLFLSQSLGCKLIPNGKHQFITRCPLPGHADSTPSFKVSTEKNLAYCFGCQRGGDVLEIARWYLNTASFIETLIALEKEGEIFDGQH